ncbi:hypothetical protein BBD42_26215 [Paenibacillus sp. BIHB 4019]|uniref:VWFA domain-containing protein n=1 Tax=Paenibacillus sp. BIHB 4019 TaxID=1870819 RepID=A0A1B2DPE7_9BACL|nr:VWA domain-containing protein [Paenibacillus sp. BIHB 4019]ANY69589.1 hypothetical protein BBD42_26215 [Paenibacillus sp. BIHB 4019]
MQLLSPLSALFGLALPAIVLMYLFKRTYMDTEIASHMLWNRMLREQEANRPWQKLRTRPLMLLQLLAAAVLVLALMQPYLTADSRSGSHTVIVLDRSASMTAAMPGGSSQGSLLHAAVQQAELWLSEQQKGELITLLVTGEQPRIILSKETDHELVLQQLKAITPDFGAQDNVAALSLADSLLANEQGGKILLLTDGRWQDADSVNLLTLHAKLEQFKPTAPQAGSNNSAILYFGIHAAVGEDGKRAGVVTLRNDSAASKQIQLAVYADKESEPAATKSVKLEAGGWTSVDMNGLPEEASYYTAKISGATDDYAADNIAYQFPIVSKAQQVLLATSGNLFLEKALQLAGVKTIKVDPAQYVPSKEHVKDIDWVIMDGDIAKLRTDKSWQELFASKPVWYIDHPEATGEETASPANSRVAIAGHPVTAYLSFEDTHIGRMVKANDAGTWGEAIVTYGGLPAIYAGSVQGRPQLRFTFDMQSSDLPLRPEFPVLIVQAADWMSGGSQAQLGTADAGSALQLAFLNETVSAKWEMIETIGGYSEKSLPDSNLSAALAAQEPAIAPAVPGLYRLMEQNAEGETIGQRMLAVNAASAESASMSATADIKPIAAASSETSQNQADAGSAAGSMETANAANVFAAWLALALLALMLVEWEVYRRGNAG